MPTPIDRISLTVNLEDRYTNQRVGGAFDVKKTLGDPGTVPPAGEVLNAKSIQGKLFQSPDGFEVGVRQGQSQLIEAQGNTSEGLSQYVNGLSTVKYDP